MSAPYITSESILTAEDVADQIDATCARLRALGDVVIRLAYQGATSADLSKVGRRVAVLSRVQAELSLDDLRSMLVEALTGVMPCGYANTTDLANAMAARLDANDAAARQAREIQPDKVDASLILMAHARGAAIVAMAGQVLVVEPALS